MVETDAFPLAPDDEVEWGDTLNFVDNKELFEAELVPHDGIELRTSVEFMDDKNAFISEAERVGRKITKGSAHQNDTAFQYEYFSTIGEDGLIDRYVVHPLSAEVDDQKVNLTKKHRADLRYRIRYLLNSTQDEMFPAA